MRDLISVDDVMSEMAFGPNGALIFCMEFLADNPEWLGEQLDGYSDDDYLLLDCPGQIELYSHIPVFKRVAAQLQAAGFNVVVVYCVDSLFVTDASKLIAGNLTALAAMVHLELPHINLLTKCDLVDRGELERYLAPSGEGLVAELGRSMGPRFRAMNAAIARLLDDYDMVSFLPCDVTDEDALDTVLLHVDNAIQYGEDMEPREPRDEGDDGGRGGAGRGEEDAGGRDDGDV